jgi:peptidoglycan/LPS O-acetylase OafA/YrhL
MGRALSSAIETGIRRSNARCRRTDRLLISLWCCIPPEHIITHRQELGRRRRAFATSIANILFNGNFAVCFFFVLSGYVLSYRFLQDGDTTHLWIASIKRYPRLMIPALASLFCVVLVDASGGFHISEATRLAGRYIADGPHEIRSFISIFVQGLFGVFFTGDFRLNGILWTIAIEFYGSFLVFGLLLVFRRSRWRWLGYASATALFFGDYYMAFPIGVAIAGLRIRPGGMPRLAVMSAVIGLILGSYPPYSAGDGIWIWPLLVFHDKARLVSRVLGAAFLLLAVSQIPSKAIFDHPVFRFLGRISFSFYLIHFIVLSSLTSLLVLQLTPILGYLPAIAIAFAATIPAVLIMSYAFARVIDEPATRLADRFAKAIVNLVRSRALRPEEALSTSERRHTRIVSPVAPGGP